MASTLAYIAFFCSLLWKPAGGTLPAAVREPQCISDPPRQEGFIADCREMLKRLQYTNLHYSSSSWNPN